MHANLLGLAAVVLSLVAFQVTWNWLRNRALATRWIWLAVFTVLAIPAAIFGIYYLHIVPEQAWVYTFRSWHGTEILVILLGCAAGAWAAVLPRVLLILPLFGMLALAGIPYIKPLVAPLQDSEFKDRWQGGVCLQSTTATCGPASVCSILCDLGVEAKEREVARAAFSYKGGTEAWYLARYVRGRGLVPRFEFRDTFTPAAGLPAVVGVRLGGAGHFIAVLKMDGDQISYADPVWGRAHLPLAEFLRQYEFTGFHMVISKE